MFVISLFIMSVHKIIPSARYTVLAVFAILQRYVVVLYAASWYTCSLYVVWRCACILFDKVCHRHCTCSL